ncbi:AMP-binding protein [Streptomyces sp. XD-27]|uniref:AMP-binding protein n=1 Tax=Streptomyces sp. XD-27 TaxID=3062779 RepID=UPI0026F44EF7|nr:AMP-binding protein [Streptomyces sp. XD-27]WKX70476.1 AMP-binding protein [Streptomyces sp. XD-27]
MPLTANLADTLLARATRSAGDTAVIHQPAVGPTQRVLHHELDHRARAVATWLRTHDAPGRRVLIAMDSGPHAAAALLACLYVGAVAVPVPAPTPSRTAVERTAAIAKDAAVHLVLTEAAHASEISRQLTLAGRLRLTCLAVDCLPPTADTRRARRASAHRDPRVTWQPARTTPDTLALLAYDSGPATAPRGARITHGSLLAIMCALRRMLGTGRTSRIGGWLPRHHTLGLIGQLLHPLWLGATAVLLPPRPDPVEWLRAISLHAVTETVAPDSHFARCAARALGEPGATLPDLSRLRTAVNAGEPVSAATMAAFARRCTAAGLAPGVFVPGYAPAEAAPWLATAGRGPVPGAELRVVDPHTRATLPDGEQGEIWARGPAVASGHWGNPPDAADVFGARTAEGAGGYLRTGDLGFVRNGEVRFTGRLHETLLTSGVTLHTQDAERELLGCRRPLGTARVFCTGPGTGHLVVVQEVRTAGGSRAGLPRLAEEVRARIAAEFGAAVDGVLLVRPGTLRRAGSAKIAGSVLREQFLRGEVRALHAEFAPGMRAGYPVGPAAAPVGLLRMG